MAGLQYGPVWHGERHGANYEIIARDYSLKPVKPCMDGEARYENHPIGFNPMNGRFNAHDIREAAYWAVFSGAFGHTYGCAEIYQFYVPGKYSPASYARLHWIQALELPGARQIIHLRRLLESRPAHLRRPDTSILAMDPGSGADHVASCRAIDGSYALIYTPNGRPIKVRLDKISGRVSAWWYDPSSGVAYPAGEYPNKGVNEFEPPWSGPEEDWALVLDDESRYAPLG